jgi:hypothetical protein
MSWEVRRQAAVLLLDLIRQAVPKGEFSSGDVITVVRGALVRENQPKVRTVLEAILGELEERPSVTGQAAHAAPGIS